MLLWVRVRLDRGSLGLGLLAVGLAVGLGTLAGSTAGTAAGILAALVGLIPPVLLTKATEWRERTALRKQRSDDLIASFQPPGPTSKPIATTDFNDSGGGGVAWLLRPENKIVSFWPRPELSTLREWCATREHVAVSLVTGQAGTGKTRIALELLQDVEARGWKPLWVKSGLELLAVGTVRDTGRNCILIVDYAETRDSLAALLNDVASDQDGPDMRVVLLARTDGEWWHRLKGGAENSAGELLANALHVRLGPVTEKSDRDKLFDRALAAFAEKLGIPKPDARLALADRNDVVLDVHTAALLAVVDKALGSVGMKAASAQDVLTGILRHETRYWTRSATARGLNLDQGLLRLVLSLEWLVGPESEAEASRLLAYIPDLADSAVRRGEAARWANELYPPDLGVAQESHKSWISPLRPDPVADKLIVTELASRLETISCLFKDLDKRQAARALRVLSRATLTQPQSFEILRAAITADVDHLAVPALFAMRETNAAISAMLGEILSTDAMSQHVLQHFLREVPNYSSALEAVAVGESRRFASGPSDLADRSSWLVKQGVNLVALGLQEEALAAIGEAVSIYRQFAEAHPDTYLPRLAGALNSQSRCLTDLGKRDQASGLLTYRPADGVLRGVWPGIFLDFLAVSASGRPGRAIK